MSGDGSIATALSLEDYRRLYLGAMQLDGVERRLQASYVLLLGGRLGLTPSELQHLHAGWIDWDAGEIQVPAHEQCSCEACREAALAAQRHGDHRPLDEIVANDQWSPPPGSEPRTVPFGWSDRISAALAAFFDATEYLTLDRNALSTIVTDAAMTAPEIDPGSLSLGVLRRTAVEFFAEAGLGPQTIRGVTGWDEAVADRTGPDRYLSAAVYDAFGRGDDAPAVPRVDPARFPIACGTDRLDGEPFDPAAPSPDEGDPSASRRSTSGRGESDDGMGRDRYRDERDQDAGEEELHADPDEDPQGVHSATPSGQGESGSGGGSGMDNATGPRTVAGEQEEPEITVTEERLAAAMETVDERVDVTSLLVEPIRTDFSATFLTSELDEDEPVAGRVLIGQERLLLTAKPDQTDDDGRLTVKIPLSAVLDVSVEYIPSGFADKFTDAFAVAYSASGGKEVAVIEPNSKTVNGAASMLYGSILNDTRMLVVPRAKVGGRVTDESPRPMRVQIASSSIRFQGEDSSFTVDLSDVIHVDAGTRELGGRELQTVLVRHIAGDRTVTSYVGTPVPRLSKLLNRYVTLEYDPKRAAVAGLDLSEAEKEVLVALYSSNRDVDLSTILSQRDDDMTETLRSLSRAGLISTGGGGTTLTEKGRVLVGENLEDVNA